MILIQQLKLRFPHDPQDVRKKAAKALMIREEEMLSFEILRRSLDARKKPELSYVYSVEVTVKDEKKVLSRALGNRRAKEQFSVCTRVQYEFPKPLENMEEVKKHSVRPVIVGAGPAGLFCAYYLALAGMKPILLERGKCVEDRRKDVERFWDTGCLNPESNVQFGEGGAGTFSDGKLNTLVKDADGRNRAVLETFVKFGAKESILYDAKPHLGTDVLYEIIRNMRAELLKLGAEIRFETKLTDFMTENGRITGCILNGNEKMDCSQLVLAIGHSARDTFSQLLKRNVPMQPKAFAVGFRVEHPQEMINKSQYGIGDLEGLEAAAYKVTAKTKEGRGVYSFCMCPGGYVVNASSETGRLAVNGMSYSGRDGKNANSAIIVSVTPEDFPGEGALSGVEFQRSLEEKAYALGNGKIPVQRYADFRRSVTGEGKSLDFSNSELLPCCKGGYAWTDLSTLLPEACNHAFVEGMSQFGHQIKGFDRDDAILSGIESRTSSPLRILRDEHLQSEIRGLFPCGEGAGYAGGITSAAMDGLRVGEEILKQLTNA